MADERIHGMGAVHSGAALMEPVHTIPKEIADLHTIKYPVPVGGYHMGGPMGIRFSLYRKPNWFHRKMVQLILGWKWVDID
jgi:hypothetical protein